jgi:YVTN family beta-propeller protein
MRPSHLPADRKPRCLHRSLGAIALLALLNPVFGQWLEREVLLPDGFSGVAYPRILCYNEAENHIYVSDWLSDCVAIIDARTFRKVSRYLPGYGVTDLVWSRTHNRVYSADFYDSTVTVYDARARQVVATIRGLDRPWRLLLDEPRDKLYVACDRGLVVIGLATNSVQTSVAIPDPIAMLADTARNRLLVTGLQDGLYFVDPDADSVTGFVPVGGVSNRDILVINHENQKLYVASIDDTRMATVHLTSDSVAGPFSLGGLPNRLAWCPGTNRLYAATRSGLRAFDGANDELIASIRCYSADLALDTELGRVYACQSAPDDTMQWIPTYLSVRDCATLELLTASEVGIRLSRVFVTSGVNSAIWVADETGATVAAYDRSTWYEMARSSVGAKARRLAWNSAGRRLYAASEFSSTIAAVDGDGLTTDTINIGCYDPTGVYWAADNNKLYVATRGTYGTHPPQNQRIVVVNCETNRVLATLPGESWGRGQMTHSRTSNKVYVSYGTPYPKVYVVDGRTDELLTAIHVTEGLDRAVLWYADSNWVFRGGNRVVEVIDCATDEVMTSIPGVVWPTALLYNPTNNTIYCTDTEDNTSELVLIDPAGRKIRKRLPVGRWPYSMAWDSLGNRVFVGSLWEGTITVIECSLDSVIATIQIPGRVHSLAWNSLNQKLYATEVEYQIVHVIDGATLRVTASIPMRRWQDPLQMAWDPVTNRTFVASWDGSKVVVLRDDRPGIAGPFQQAISAQLTPTVLRGALTLAGQQPGRLLDVTGRKVMDLLPGENDVRHLAPGTYFIRYRSELGQGLLRFTLVR